MYQKISYLLFFLTALALPVRGQETFEKSIRMGFSSTSSSVTETTNGDFIVGCRVNRTNAIDGYIRPVIIKVDKKGNILWSLTLPVDNGFVDAVAATFDGGCFITCESPSDDGSSYSALIKIDSGGHILWKDYFTDIGLWGISKIIVRRDGGCTLGVTVFPMAQTGGILWIDSNGKVQSIAQLHTDTTRYAQINSIAEINDGSIICLAEVVHNNVSEHSGIMKFSKVGKLIWEKKMNKGISLRGIEKTYTGGFAVCGYLKPNKLSADDAYIGKFDSIGNFLWGISINAFDHEGLNSIVETLNGDLIAGGIRGANSFIANVDENGVVRTIKEISIPNKDSRADVLIKTSDRRFVFTGYLNDTGAFLLFKLDSNLTGCHTHNILYNVQSIEKPTDTILFFTTNDTINYESGLVGNGDSVAYKETDLCNITSVAPLISEKENILLFPNPITSQEPLTISIDGLFPAGIYTLSLRDLLGKEIKYEKINLTGRKQDILFDMHECAAGIYFIELENEKEVVAKAKVVKE